MSDNKFTMEFDLDNDQFAASEDLGSEIAWVVDQAAIKIRDNYVVGNIRDRNGNSIGHFHINIAAGKGKR